MKEDLLGAPGIPMEPLVVGCALQEIEDVLDAIAGQCPPLRAVVQGDSRVFLPWQFCEQALGYSAKPMGWGGSRVQEPIVVKVDSRHEAGLRPLAEIQAAVDTEELRVRVESLDDLRIALDRKIGSAEQTVPLEGRASGPSGIQ